MRFRRISEHIRQQDWTAVTLDFLIVVIGVFVGLQVANWNESRAEDRREIAYLERLSKEFDVVEARVTRAIAVGETRQRATKAVIHAWETGPNAFSDPDQKRPGELFIEIIANVVPTNPPAAFRELVSSGDLSIIKNEDLRTALYEFDALSEVTRSAYNTTQNDMRPLRQLITSAYQFDIDTLEKAFRITGTGDGGNLGTLEGEFIPEVFFGNPDFQQALNGASMSIINMRVLAEQQQALLDRIETIIAEELAK